MAPVEPVYCPECRSEYLGTATVCVECDVALVSESELGASAEAELPPIAGLVCIRAASVGWARGLSERLAAEGISHRIEVAGDDLEDGGLRRPGAKLPYGVYVRPEDVGVASRVDAAFTRSQIPDLPDEPVGTELERCPACDGELGAGLSECPECGLALDPGE